VITTPDLLSALREQVRAGVPINFRQASTEQALNIAIAGRQFVEESIRMNEEYDDQLAAIARDGSGA
jgi:DNA-binding NarL/FixJ family response regulator